MGYAIKLFTVALTLSSKELFLKRDKMKNIDIDRYVGIDKLVSIEIKNGLRLRRQILSYCKETNMIEFKTLKKTSFIDLNFVLLIEIMKADFKPEKPMQRQI